MVSDALNSFGIKEAFAKKRNLYDFYFHKYQHETMEITMKIKGIFKKISFSLCITKEDASLYHLIMPYF